MALHLLDLFVLSLLFTNAPKEEKKKEKKGKKSDGIPNKSHKK